jgi:methyl-accepting chemotaxis protein
MSWFYNLSFRWKLALPTGLVVVVFMAILSMVLSVFNDLARTDALQSDEVQPVLNEMEEGYRDLYQVITAGQGVILAAGDQDRIKYNQQEFYDDSSKTLTRFKSPTLLLDNGFINASGRVSVETLPTLYSQWLTHYAYIAENPDSAADYYQKNQKQIQKEFNQLQAAYKDIRIQIEQAQLELKEQMNDEISLTIIVLEVGALVAIILSIVITWFVSSIILAPLQRLSTTMENIASGEGDLTQRVPVESRDEIGQLATAFNEFVSKIHATITEVSVTMKSVREETQQIQKETQGVVLNASEQQAESAHVATAVHQKLKLNFVFHCLLMQNQLYLYSNYHPCTMLQD